MLLNVSQGRKYLHQSNVILAGTRKRFLIEKLHSESRMRIIRTPIRYLIDLQVLQYIPYSEHCSDLAGLTPDITGALFVMKTGPFIELRQSKFRSHNSPEYIFVNRLHEVRVYKPQS